MSSTCAARQGDGVGHGGEAWEQVDTRLHCAMARAAHNELMLAVFETIDNLKSIWGGLRPRPAMPDALATSAR